MEGPRWNSDQNEQMLLSELSGAGGRNYSSAPQEQQLYTPGITTLLPRNNNFTP